MHNSSESFDMRNADYNRDEMGGWGWFGGIWGTFYFYAIIYIYFYSATLSSRLNICPT